VLWVARSSKNLQCRPGRNGPPKAKNRLLVVNGRTCGKRREKANNSLAHLRRDSHPILPSVSHPSHFLSTAMAALPSPSPPPSGKLPPRCTKMTTRMDRDYEADGIHDTAAPINPAVVSVRQSHHKGFSGSASSREGSIG
jgi:hypothetical protein